MATMTMRLLFPSATGRRSPPSASAALAALILLTLTTALSVVDAFVILPSSRTATAPTRQASRRQWDSSTSRQRATPVEEDSTFTTQADVEFDPDAPLPHAYVAEQTRPDFDILQTAVATKGPNHNEESVPLVYLDSGATSQKPRQVLEQLDVYYKQLNSNVHRGAHTLSRQATAAYEAARQTVADFVHAASASEIVFTSGATEAVNLVAQSYGRSNLQAGDELVLTVAEHHSNLVPWLQLAAELDLKLNYVQTDPQTGGLNLEQFENLLTDKTKLVAFQHVSNVLSCINPVEKMVAAVRSKASPDAVVLLDACQSVPHMSVHVQELGVDFLVASGHKMCGPTGIGFLWGRYSLLESMPPWKGGGEMIDQVSLTAGKTTWQPPPARFEAGTPAIAQAVGLGAAVDYLQNVGMEDIAAYEHELAAYLYHRLAAVPGVTVLGPADPSQRAGLAAFVHESIHASDLSTFLDMDGIAIRAGHHCCQPLHTEELGYSHSARASLYFYNTKEDVDAFIQSLENTIQFFAGVEKASAKKDGDSSSTANGDDDDDDGFVPFI